MIKVSVNKSGKKVYDIPKTARESRVVLYDYEIQILMQVITYGVVRGVELNDFATEIRRREGHTGKNPQGNTTTRLQKLRNANLLKSYQVGDILGYDAQFRTHFTSYSKRTLDVLLEIGHISEKEYATYYQRLSIIQRNRRDNNLKIHSNAIAALGTRLYIELTNYLSPDTFVICKGVHHRLFAPEIQNHLNKTDTLIYPDLIMELPDNKLVAFEVDGGKQLRDVLTEKVKKYNSLMENEYFKDYKLRVVFLPIDADFMVGEGRENVTARIGYIKDVFNFEQLANSQVELFCYRYLHLNNHIRSILYNEDITSEKRDTFIAEYWIEHAITPMANNEYYINPVSWQSVLPHSELGGYAPHACVELNYYNNPRTTYLFIYHMRAGNIKSKQILDEIYTSVKGIKRGVNIDIRIMLVYESKAHRENDTLKPIEKNMSVEIMATSIDEWTNLKTGDELPIYERSINSNSYRVLKGTI